MGLYRYDITERMYLYPISLSILQHNLLCVIYTSLTCTAPYIYIVRTNVVLGAKKMRLTANVGPKCGNEPHRHFRAHPKLYQRYNGPNGIQVRAFLALPAAGIIAYPLSHHSTNKYKLYNILTD